MIRPVIAIAILALSASPLDAQDLRRCYKPFLGIFVTPCRDEPLTYQRQQRTRRGNTQATTNPPSTGVSIGVGADVGVSVGGNLSQGIGSGISRSVGGVAGRVNGSLGGLGLDR